MAKLKGIDTAALLAELQRRRHLLPTLQKRRQKLAAQLSELDSQIAGLDSEGVSVAPVRRGPGRPRKSAATVGDSAGRSPGRATTGPRKRRRRRNEVSLADTLADVVRRDPPMTVGEIMDAVQKRGYKSSSSQFRNIINQRLTKDKRFKRVGRGQYVRAG